MGFSVSSARPKDLNTFVTDAGVARQALDQQRQPVLTSYRSFVSQPSDYTVNAADAFADLQNFQTDNETDEAWVDTVRHAFVMADWLDGDLSCGPVYVLDRDINHWLEKAGLQRYERSTITYDDPVLHGLPASSGWSNDPVCTANGNFVEVETDLTLPGRSNLISVARVYNSRAASDVGAFGRGWSSWNEAIAHSAADGSVTWRGPDGARATFHPDGNGGFERVVGLPGRLVTAAGGGLRLELDGGTVWHYDAAGRPVAIDGGDARAELRWEGDRLVRLEHPRSGRWVALSWDETAGRVVQVEASDGRAVRYRYDDAGDLVEVDNPATGPQRYEGAHGYITAIVDADGVRVVDNVYDAQGRVVTQRSPFGRTVRFAYQPGGRTVVTDDDGGPANTFLHDHAGRLVASVDGSGHAHIRRFDGEGRLIGWTERGGGTWNYRLDDVGRIAAIVAPDGAEERWAYDALGRAVEHHDATGGVTRHAYRDALHTPVRVEDPEGGVTLVDVADDDLPVRVTDADGVTVEYEWDTDGQLAAVRDALGHEVRCAYDAAGQLVSLTDATGAVTEWQLDAGGRVLHQRGAAGALALSWSAAGRGIGAVDAAGSAWAVRPGRHGAPEAIVDPGGAVVALDYDVLGNRTSMRAPDGAEYAFAFDAVCRLVAVADPAGTTWHRQYDPDGALVAEVAPDGSEWRQRLDACGRPIRLEAPDGRTFERRNDSAGRLIAESQPGGADARWRYDRAGRLVEAVAGDGAVTTFEWSPAGRLLVAIAPDGGVWRHEYDDAGRPVGLQHPDGYVELAELDASGRVIAHTSPGGRTTRYGYGPTGAVERVVSPSGATTAMEYDAAGRPLALTGPDASRWAWQWDQRGLLESVTDPLGDTSSYAYDARGRLARATDPMGGATGFAYDIAGRPIAQTDPLGRTTWFERDLLGRPTAVRFPDGTGRKWWWDAAGALMGVTSLDATERGAQMHPAPAGERLVRVVEETTDADGLLVGVRAAGDSVHIERDVDGVAIALHGVTAAGAPIATIEHDAAGRVTALRRDGAEVRFGYDRAGQLVELVDAKGERRSFEWDPAGRLVAERRAQGRAQEVVHHAYDAAGQRTETRHADGRTTTYRYDAAGRLVGQRHTDGARASYTWDEAGRLAAVERTDIDGQRVDHQFEVDADGTVLAVDGRAGVPEQPSLADPDTDTDAMAALATLPTVERSVRWAAGAPVDPWSPDAAVRIGGLAWLGYRVYDADLRSFLSPDPYEPVPGRPGAGNPYHYCWNDPVNWADPLGLRPMTDAEYAAFETERRKGTFQKSWEAMKNDPWGSLAMVGVLVAGAALCFVPGGQAIGIGILVGAGSQMIAGVATGSFDPRAVAISGAVGALTGGGSAALSKVGFSAFQRGMATSAVSDTASQLYRTGGDITAINPARLAFATLTGGLVGKGIDKSPLGQMKFGRPYTEPPRPQISTPSSLGLQHVGRHRAPTPYTFRGWVSDQKAIDEGLAKLVTDSTSSSIRTEGFPYGAGWNVQPPPQWFK